MIHIIFTKHPSYLGVFWYSKKRCFPIEDILYRKMRGFSVIKEEKEHSSKQTK
jgi:hypothetical protein